jgi:hypothetical protein
VADLLDELGSGLKTAGQTALAIPQAIGGGALDILIGDRENVPVGEQIKRSIEALILAGDNPSNLIGIHAMNARRDAATQAIVASPDFQRSLQVNQTVQNLSPMDAYAVTAKQYGVHGYAPDTALSAVDLAPGGPSAPERQTVPILPHVAIDDLLKNETSRYGLARISQGSPDERELALSGLTHLKPPLDLQTRLANQVLDTQEIPGQTTRTIDWKDGTLGVRVQQLHPDQQTYGTRTQAADAAYGANLFAQNSGLPDRHGIIESPDGTFGMYRSTDPTEIARAGVVGKAAGTITPVPGDTRTPAEIAQQQLADKYSAQLQYERDKAALDSSVSPLQAKTQAAASIKEADPLISMIDQYLAVVKPENVGAVGDLRQLKYGVAAQQQAFANLQQSTMDSMAENNLRPGTGKGIEAIPGYFDPSLSLTDVLGGVIAYRTARMLNGGRLSDQDVNDQKTKLGLDRWFGNDQDIAARMRVMRSFAETQKTAAQNVLSERPVAPSRPLQTVPLGGGRRAPASAAATRLNNAFMAK